jgi:hypothetical protein
LFALVRFSGPSTRHTMIPVNADCRIECRSAGRAQNQAMHTERRLVRGFQMVRSSIAAG